MDLIIAFYAEPSESAKGFNYNYSWTEYVVELKGAVLFFHFFLLPVPALDRV